jgi:hypothetical protein
MYVTLDAATFLAAASILPLASRDATRPAMCAMRVVAGPDGVEFVTTDGHALARANVRLTDEERAETVWGAVTIPASAIEHAIRECKALLGRTRKGAVAHLASVPLRIATGVQGASISLPGHAMLFSPVDDEASPFPAYRDVTPAPGSTTPYSFAGMAFDARLVARVCAVVDSVHRWTDESKLTAPMWVEPPTSELDPLVIADSAGRIDLTIVTMPMRWQAPAHRKAPSAPKLAIVR